MILDKDTFSIVQSYFDIEDILILYADNLEVRDKLIQKYYPILPDISDLITNNSLESIKYVIQNSDQEPNYNHINWTIQLDKPKIFKYLFEYRDPESKMPIWCDYENYWYYSISDDRLEIYQYIMDYYQHKYSDDDLNYALSCNSCKIIKYLYLEQKILPTDSDIKHVILNDSLVVLKILGDLGYQFTQEHLKYASFQGMLEIVEYFVSLGLKLDVEILNFIISEGNMDMIRYFIDSGVKPNKETYRIIQDYDLQDIKQYLKSVC